MKLVVFFITFLMFFSCHSTSLSRDDNQTERKILVDTDMGNDDWIAILYLLKHPKADFLGVTLSGGGLSGIKEGIQHMVRLQELAETLPRKNISIAIGRKEAFTQKNPYPVTLRNQTNNFYGLDRNITHVANISNLSAEDFLIQQVNKHKAVEILALGPLTNIALAIQKDKTFANKVGRLVIMGGAINVSGNVHFLGHKENTSAEFNIFSDPEAASIVFASGIPIDLVSLDSTNLVPIDMNTLAELQQKEQSNSIKFILSLFEKIRGPLIEPGLFYAWDPLAAVVLMEEDFYSKQEVFISVDTKKGSTYGKTYINAHGSSVFMVVPKQGISLREAWQYRFLKVL